ncbi:small, acid-soluble spore protein, H family [Peribacillus simplex]
MTNVTCNEESIYIEHVDNKMEQVKSFHLINLVKNKVCVTGLKKQ